MPPKRQPTEAGNPQPVKRRALAPRPDVRALNRALEEREQQRQSQDPGLSAGSGLTPELMQMMALAADPMNPNQALRRIDCPPLSPPLISNHDSTMSLAMTSANCSPTPEVPNFNGSSPSGRRQNEWSSQHRLPWRSRARSVNGGHHYPSFILSASTDPDGFANDSARSDERHRSVATRGYRDRGT
jgi:hypothetical protein